MDVLPAHLNGDSFRDSFKGLVALEIIIDLPIGFPINNIISLSTDAKHAGQTQHGPAPRDPMHMSHDVVSRSTICLPARS